jgi:hypothetical protein
VLCEIVVGPAPLIRTTTTITNDPIPSPRARRRRRAPAAAAARPPPLPRGHRRDIEGTLILFYQSSSMLTKFRAADKARALA